MTQYVFDGRLEILTFGFILMRKTQTQTPAPLFKIVEEGK
jgi:hypothetical protein